MHVDLVGLIVWMILGALAGWLAGRVLAGSDRPVLSFSPFGAIGDALAGAFGAYLGALVLAFAWTGAEVGVVVTVAVAALGAVLAVLVLRCGGATVRTAR